jgi:hypothetical protein
MKIIITLIALLMTGSLVQAQDRKSEKKQHGQQVPQVVLDSFAVRYPGVANVEWEKEGRHWEAEMKQGGNEMKAIFNMNGNFLYIETPMQVSELPKEVMKFMAEYYPQSKITGSGKIIDVNGVQMYEVELKGTAHLFFDTKGEFLNRED